MWIECVSLLNKQNKEDTFLASWLKKESINSERGNTEPGGAWKNQSTSLTDTRESAPPTVCKQTTHYDVLEKHYVYIIVHEPLQWIQPNYLSFRRSWGLPGISSRKEAIYISVLMRAFWPNQGCFSMISKLKWVKQLYCVTCLLPEWSQCLQLQAIGVYLCPSFHSVKCVSWW